MAEGATFDWRTMRAIAIVFFAARLVLLVAARPYMDETYYWIWGQHLSLSYFDHPALIGWTQALAAQFGWNIIALRLPVFLTLVGDLILLRLIAGQLAGERWRDSFWTIAAIFLGTPIFLLLTGTALPDHLLLLLSLLTVYAMLRYRDGQRLGWLYLAGLAIGLATLSKYTGALLGAGALVYLLATPTLRAAFRSPHLYVAALIALALQAPVVLWNLQNNWASFGFIVEGRAGLRNPLSFGGISGYLLGALAVVGPFLLWPMLRFATARRDGNGFPRVVFWLSSALFLAASFFTNILIHWNAIAYVAVLPLLAPYLRSRLLVGAQLVYGALAIGVAFVNFGLLPVTALVGPADRTSAWSYGWDEVAAEVTALRHTQPVDFIATPNYALAAPLGFALHDAGVTSLSSRRDAYASWFDAAAHRGQTALIITDKIWTIDRMPAVFQSVTPLKTIDIVRFGRPIDTYTIYLGTGYSPG